MAALLAGTPFAERSGAWGGDDRRRRPVRRVSCSPIRRRWRCSARRTWRRSRRCCFPGRAPARGVSPVSPQARPPVRRASSRCVSGWRGGRCRWRCCAARIGDKLVLATPPAPGEVATAAPPPQPVASHAPPPRRFLWRLDGEERFVAADPALVAAFGDSAPLDGETLAAFRARAGFDHDGKLAAALAARRTFAALPLTWGEGRRALASR